MRGDFCVEKKFVRRERERFVLGLISRGGEKFSFLILFGEVVNFILRREKGESDLVGCECYLLYSKGE